jgi:hypothetical protein
MYQAGIKLYSEMAIIKFQEVGSVVSNCLSLRNSRRKRRHGEGGKAHKKCMWGEEMALKPAPDLETLRTAGNRNFFPW